MVTELQFVAIAVFLIWCLISSLCGLLNPEPDAARLVWREHGPAGWGKWREVHFGLTAADERVLSQPEPVLDRAARDALLETVRHQDRRADTDAVQFAIVRLSLERDQATAVYVSDHIAAASAGASVGLRHADSAFRVH
jgi:hypothetical protein